jgi:hypothetical protein
VPAQISGLIVFFAVLEALALIVWLVEETRSGRAASDRIDSMSGTRKKESPAGREMAEAPLVGPAPLRTAWNSPPSRDRGKPGCCAAC